MKGKVKRIVSGLLSVMTILTTVAQPLTTCAAEPEPTAFEVQYPALDAVRDMLSAEEIVTASDYEVAIGSAFDVKSDFSGLEIQTDKVKVTLHEAKNSSGEEFDVNKADVYRAVYMVEPRSEHPSYHVVRNIKVKEPVTKTQTETASEDSGYGGQDEEDSEEDGESHSEKPSQNEPVKEQTKESEIPQTQIKSEEELDAALQMAQGQETVDQETGLSFGEVMMQAAEQGVDFTELEAGESLTFTAQSKKLRAARASQKVTVTQGDWYYYADYGLGTYLTSPFTVTFGNVTATAYCIEPSKPGPGSGTYQITKLEGNRELAKVCYYGTEAAGSSAFFAKHHTDFSTGKRFVITHLAASYANGSSDAFYGTNSTGESLAMELYNYAIGQPDIPDVEMSFSNGNVTAYVDGNGQSVDQHIIICHFQKNK
ncbi:thioester domain-containing protein [Mediterraneibacter gnavus]|uniref:thioester domain-containing protein n=1 Tax=Mediterraneibacter gnavus TaxID=33038 RepID=UPI001185359E|nr:thioester domain-containing protein [Mediterraneibacter gnavus]